MNKYCLVAFLSNQGIFSCQTLIVDFLRAPTIPPLMIRSGQSDPIRDLLPSFSSSSLSLSEKQRYPVKKVNLGESQMMF